MEQTYNKNSSSLSADDFKFGIHFLPEVRLHEQVASYKERHGRPMSIEEVNSLADFIYTTSDAQDRYTKSPCPVCRDYIADCMLRGVDPWEPNVEVINALRKFGVHFKRWKGAPKAQGLGRL